MLSLAAFAQTPQVGHTTITFNDAARTGGFGSGGGPGRQIQSEVYYPATTAGTDVAAMAGAHPVVVFGHGFVMAWDAYENVWEALVAEGYIVVFPRTEGGFSPDHNEFAMDLAHLVNEMQALNTDAGSLFFGHVASKSAIMGHSMGGGATFLAAANNSSIETAIGLAPAETNPSAIAAAAQVSVPTVVFSGSADGVTPAQDHHQPIYNALNVSCKHFISITGGAHCYFANANFNCDFGEGTASSGISVTRTEQQTIMNDYVIEWLDYKLKDDCIAFGNFTSMVPTDSRITYQDSCSSSGLTITANGSTTLCAGESLTIDAGQVVDWSDGSTGSSLTVTQAGSYFAIDNSTCAVSNAIAVTVNPLPDVTVSQSGNTLTANQSNATYQWVDCDDNNNPINGATNATFTATQTGNYAVVVTLNGCSGTSSCSVVTSVSIDEFNQSFELQQYPNPVVDGMLYFKSDRQAQLEIVNIAGELIAVSQITKGDNVVQLDVSQGMYFWTCISQEGIRQSGRIIVKK